MKMSSQIVIFVIIGLLVCFITFCRANAQAVMPTTTDFSVGWDPNPETYLSGYTVKLGRQSGVYTESFDAGNPPQELRCDGPTVLFSIENKLTQGFWYSVVIAYGTDGQNSENSDELVMRVRPTELQYSFDNVNWMVDRLRLVKESNLYSLCAQPAQRILKLGNSHKFYRYLYQDELPPLPTLPVISEKGVFLQWDVPHPENHVSKFNIYKKQNNVWILEGVSFPPSASYKLSSQGEYCISSVTETLIEGQKSNSVMFSLSAPTSLRVIQF